MKQLANLIAEVIKKLGVFKGINSQKFTVVSGTVAASLYWCVEAYRIGLSDLVICTGVVCVNALAAWYIHKQGVLDHTEKLLGAPPKPKTKNTRGKR